MLDFFLLIASSKVQPSGIEVCLARVRSILNRHPTLPPGVGKQLKCHDLGTTRLEKVNLFIPRGLGGGGRLKPKFLDSKIGKWNKQLVV